MTGMGVPPMANPMVVMDMVPQVGALLDGEHNAAHGDDGHDDAEEIQAAGQPRQVRHHEPHHDDGYDAEGNINEEDPFPTNGAHNDPAEDGAGERGEAGNDSPHSPGCAVAVAGKNAVDDAHGLRGDERRADSLNGAGNDEGFHGGR